MVAPPLKKAPFGFIVISYPEPIGPCWALTPLGKEPAERFVRTIKESCLERMILFGEESLRTAMHNFVAHYHTERNHQGLANRLISPEAVIFEKQAVAHRANGWAAMLTNISPPAPEVR